MPAERLFDLGPYAILDYRRNWDVAGDGRFLMSKYASDATNRIVIVSHWVTALRSRMGAK